MLFATFLLGILSVARGQLVLSLSAAEDAASSLQSQINKFEGANVNASRALKCGEISSFAQLSTHVSLLSSVVEHAKPYQLASIVPAFASFNAQLIGILEEMVEKAGNLKRSGLQALVATQISALSFPLYDLNSHFLDNLYRAHNNDVFNSAFYAAYSAASAVADAAREYTADVPRLAVESKGPEGHFVFYMPGVPIKHTEKASNLASAMPLAQEQCDNVIRLLHSPQHRHNSTELYDGLQELSSTYIGLRDLCRRQMHHNLQRSPRYYVDSYSELASSLTLIITELGQRGEQDYRLSTELTVLSYPVRCFSHIFLQMVSDINCKYYPDTLRATKELARAFEESSNAFYRMNLELGRCSKLEVEWEQWGRWLFLGLIIAVFLILFGLYLIINRFQGAVARVEGLISFLNQMTTARRPLEGSRVPAAVKAG